MTTSRKARPALSLSRPPRSVGQQQDEARAKAFIQAAAMPTEPQESPDSQAQAKLRGEPVYPWEDPDLREDVLKTFNVRLPEPTKAKLEWLSKQGPQSMHQIVLEAVETAIERRIRELTA